MSEIINNGEYKELLSEIKQRVRSAQLKAATAVNTELLRLYWDMAAKIVDKQKDTQWGDGLLPHISRDLCAIFPDIKGFSVRNLKYMRQWFQFWTTQKSIGQQAVAQLQQIPWGHNILIITKIADVVEAEFYVQKTLQNGWSRAVLEHQIESGLYERQGKALSNFASTLPAPQSDLAKQLLKDPYCFDFLTIAEKHDEVELEAALVGQLTHFLLELGSGFSYLGRQYHLEVNGDDFFIDLLFYHVRLHCYIVVELKTGKFKPEYAGKLNFYVSAVDDLLGNVDDKPTIGILICKEKNNMVVEYALRDINKPIGVSRYVITRELPVEFSAAIPNRAAIESELAEFSSLYDEE
ncbi:MAG: PDDEXK nuclease domain-containing protein [Bacillota bacterium]